MIADDTFGFLSLMPPLVVVIVALLTKKSIEPLLIGCLVGCFMIDNIDFLISSQKTIFEMEDILNILHLNFLNTFLVSLITTLRNPDLLWIILVCCFFGFFIRLISFSGGSEAFGLMSLKYVKTKKQALFVTYLVCIVIFIDDYLNELTSGNTMKKITDKFNIPREVLAYIVNSTATSICVIIPFSTWAFYIGKLIKTENINDLDAFSLFLKIIPYNLYGWINLIIVLLFIIGVIPYVGKMKRADIRAATSGQLTPNISKYKQNYDTSKLENKKKSPEYFLIPIVILIASTIILDFDALKGITVATMLTSVYFLIFKIMNYDTIFDCFLEGMKDLFFVIAILTMSYVLKDIGDQMKMTEFVVDRLKNTVNSNILPFLTFISIGGIALATGSSWGIYAIAVPMILPLALATNSDVWLMMGALVSAGLFGANACFYSDASLMTATGTECDNFEHGTTQFPYAFLSFIITALGYLILGFYVQI